MEAEVVEKQETARDRVRRLLINPLQDLGMRFRHRTSEDEEKRTLNRICDELSYCHDLTLKAVCEWASAHGAGAERCFWPPALAFISTAHAYQPRPIEELPAIKSWFGSRAGPAARDAGRLVPEFVYTQKHRKPPVEPAAKRWVADKCKLWARRIELAEDRISRGVEPGAEERQFLAWYAQIEKRALAIVEAGEQKRGEAGA